MKLVGLIGALFFSVVATGCGAGSASEETDEETTEGALGDCSECKTASDLFARSVVVEISNGGTDPETAQFVDLLQKLGRLMAAGVKDLPEVNGSALGPDVKKESLRFIASADSLSVRGEEQLLVVKGALAKGLLATVGERRSFDGVLPVCTVAPQSSAKGDRTVDGAQCAWALGRARVKVDVANRGKLTDAQVARLIALAYEPQK